MLKKKLTTYAHLPANVIMGITLGTLIVIPDVSTMSTPGKVRNIENNGCFHILVFKV
jgi:hypothetical protein